MQILSYATEKKAESTVSDNWKLSTQGSYGDEYQVCSSKILQLPNSGEILLRVASEKEQEAASENTQF